MIKRRFYRFEHGDRDAPSDSSSSSDSEVEATATSEEEEEGEAEEENVESEERKKGEASSSSGYETDSSANEVNLDSSGAPASDDDGGGGGGDAAAQNGILDAGQLSATGEDSILGTSPFTPEKDETHCGVIEDCILKCKSVFKCRLCPRIVCLSEETLKAHLASKKHARSEKLHKEGRLKLMLNSEGKIEGEAHLENHSPTTVSEQKSFKQQKRSKGRDKQNKRPRQETRSGRAGPRTKKRDKRKE